MIWEFPPQPLSTPTQHPVTPPQLQSSFLPSPSDLLWWSLHLTPSPPPQPAGDLEEVPQQPPQLRSPLLHHPTPQLLGCSLFLQCPLSLMEARSFAEKSLLQSPWL